MINLIRSEWIKLRTLTVNYIMLGIGLGFVTVVSALVAVFGGDSGSGSDLQASSGDIAEIVGGTSALAALLVSVVGALSISAEFGSNTIRPTLVATPSRLKVFLAKPLVLAPLAMVWGLVVGLVGYLVGFVIFSLRGAEGLTLFDNDGTLKILFVGLPIYFMLLVLFGYGLGLLIRNSPAAVTLVVLWPVLIETILASALTVGGVDDPGKFLPYQASIALIVADTSDFSYGSVGGALFFGIVIAVLVAGAIALNDKRDV